jgi:two-component system sensor histidine kinase KdpD
MMRSGITWRRRKEVVMNDEVELHTVEERIPALEGRKMFRWPRFLLESVLAIGGSLAVTGFIGLFQLYPKIPNISLVYLLVILLLASTLGRYAAVLASVTAFLAFDYFLVPPFYTFVIARWEEWIALFVFLVTALLTSQLSAVMRERTDQAQRQVRETRILYELLRFANTHERLEELLSVVAYTTVRVFSSWGVRACALLFLDEHETLTTMADTSSSNEPFTLSADELILATATMTEGRIKEKRSAPPPDIQDSEHHINYYATIRPVTILRFVPLQAELHTFGVLCLRIQHPVPWFADVSRMEKDRARPGSRAAFFWTYLEQVTSLIERAFLRSAALQGSE